MADRLRSTDPEFIGRYRTLSRLGEGGMGSVYLAQDPGGRLVAVKVIRPEYAHDQQFRARFRSEVNRAREVPPFCTAEVLDADPDHETPYLVVEYVDGPSLNEVVTENGPLAGGSLHGVAVGVASALAAIHGVGVIHRDLKPRNVLFALGIPKVIDFGIARPLEPTSFHTKAEEVVGTLAYMAPERLDPETDRLLTAAVDVFAWGAVVTYAGTGRTPFGGDTPAVTAARILTQPPRIGDLPPYLAELVGAALEKAPENRPTAPELLDRLLVTGGPSTPPLPAELRREAEAAQQSGRYQTGPRRFRPARRRRIVAIGAAIAVVAGAAAGLALRDQQPVDGTTEAAPSAVSSVPAAPTGPVLFDSLRSDALFSAARGDTGSCTYQRGLRVTAAAASVMVCGDYDQTVFPASQSITVSAVLADAGSCAAVWFRGTNTPDQEDAHFADAYQVEVCAGTVRLASSIGGDQDLIATADRVTTTGVAHRIQVVTGDREATVTIDGGPALRGELTETALLSGRVLLGAVAGANARARVTFTDVQLRSGAVPDVPAVPAFTTGDAQFTAGMWLLHDAGHTAIVEPAEYLTGAEYCRQFAVDAGSPKCAKPFVPVLSAMRVSLPISAKPQYLDYRSSPAKCVDPATHAGTCQVGFGEFSTTSGETSPWPALVTVRGGQVVSVARLDLS
ncbi:serine/threonine-protein kinase [Actinoplanes awajinensis]|uniref:Protein kinase domain-containing protein n=1 Tax=Actinoplanes awajinensis subsp. mycoplanecinus TaxID=135947 RepID=A0A0X3V9V0_9ACTN|nr:serine/threonine-protein kinase [Actinoplanes awajinensis]KUL41344.1 hypothetical protein ADL15_03550 [Actinoplanes awajinensis subsp. mycoplanecinus]